MRAGSLHPIGDVHLFTVQKPYTGRVLVFLTFYVQKIYTLLMEHPIHRAAAVLGSQTRLAVLLGVTKAAVSQWSTSGRRVPAEHCPAIERETAARGAPVTCEELRPDVDWSVLRTRAIPQSSAGVVPAGGTTTDQEAA